MAIDIRRIRTQNILDSLSGGIMDQQQEDPYQSTSPTYDDQPYIPNQRNSQSIGQQVVNTPSANQDPADPRNPNRIMEAINAIYTPETRSRDRVNNLLDNAPELQEPSFARRLVAAGAGFHQGPKSSEITQGILDAPNKATMANWVAKTGPFQNAYTTENNANVNERQLAGNAATAQANLMRTESQERTNAEKNRITEESNTAKNEAALITARAKQFKAEHPDYKWDFSGKTIKVMGPDGVPVDTGMATDKVDELTRITLNTQSREKIAAGHDAASVQGAGIRAGATVDAAGVRAGKTGTTKPMTEAERRRKTRDIYDKSADQSPFIKLPSGVIELGPRPTNPGPKLDAWKIANRELHPPEDTNLGKSGSVYDPHYNDEPSTGLPMSPQGAVKVQRNPANHQQMRKSTDGGKTWIMSNDGGKTWSK